MTVDLAALAKLASDLTEGCAPGPWHGVQSGNRAAYSWWLDNDHGDSSFPDPDDVATMLNALPALVRVALAAQAALPAVEYAAGVQAQAGLGDPLPALRAALADLDR